MYKFINETNNYDKYHYVDTTKFENCDLNFLNENPRVYKLFSNDVFDYNIERNDVVIKHSNFRSNKFNAGILCLNQTHGKYKNKMLYLCKPDDKRIPFFLIPYSQPYKFDKNIKQIYITFEFMNWDNKHPYGTITQNFGTTNNLYNFYEYILYCKSLNVSIQQFTKKAKQKLLNQSNEKIINEITIQNKLDVIDENTRYVFTIDSKESNDFDDAISYDFNKHMISIYITNVAIIMDYLGLWSSFTNRISSIYLPDKRRTMLPQILVDNLCSLKEKQNKICFILDIYYDNDNNIINEEISVKQVYISKNCSYEDLKNNHYNRYIDKIKNILGINNSSDIITKLMMYMNTKIAKVLSLHKSGIYKTLYQECQDNTKNGMENLPINIQNHIKIIKNKSSNYSLFGSHVYKSVIHKDIDIYLQITSPIRRLVDIVNNIALMNCLKLYNMSEEGKNFYTQWTSVDKLNHINTCSRAIRKIQSKCKIYSIHEENLKQQKSITYEGYLFDKIIKEGDGKFQYMVYLPKLQLTTSVTLCEELNNYSKHNFSIYIFMNEINDKKKIKLQICYNEK